MPDGLGCCFWWLARRRQRTVAVRPRLSESRRGRHADLFKGDAKGFGALKKLIGDPRYHGAWTLSADSFLGQADRVHGDNGDPVDWKYLGVKRIGSAVRQYVYICRYTKAPLFWCFVAQEADGKWFLAAHLVRRR